MLAYRIYFHVLLSGHVWIVYLFLPFFRLLLLFLLFTDRKFFFYAKSDSRCSARVFFQNRRKFLKFPHHLESLHKGRMGNCLLLRGIKNSTGEDLMQSLPIIYMYYCTYLLIHLFLKRNRVCFSSSIYKLIKNQIKLQTECKLSSSSTAASSSGSGLVAGMWIARRGDHSDQKGVRKPLTVTQRQKCPLRWQWDSLFLKVKSSFHPHFSTFGKFYFNFKGEVAGTFYASLQCHRSWWNHDCSQEEKLCFDLVDRFSEGILENWRPSD